MIDDKERCSWCLCDPIAIEYHDKEWGNPVKDDKTHYEFLTLEVFQAGLNWLTILKKREIIRKAFIDFNYKEIAKFTEENIQQIMTIEGMIKYRKKIEATINNAIQFMKIQEEFGSFDKYLWNYVKGKPIINNITYSGQIVAENELSKKICKDLKKRGFQFVGSITIYSHLQSTGIINDHNVSCYKFKELTKKA